MNKGQFIYLIDVHGVDVREKEFLREDDLFVYTRSPGESGRGSSHPKLFAYENKRDAYLEAARRLEERANEHRLAAEE